MTTYLVTGGAGFIGSHLVDDLLTGKDVREVRILDNFSSGRRAHLARHTADSRVRIVECDLLDISSIVKQFSSVDVVFHLAANPDARWGIENTRLDLEQETIVTYNVLESMRRGGSKRILLSSSGTVYGDVGTLSMVESHGPCLPISLYGAGKVASEALVSAFCGTFGFSGMILRFGNVIGARTTHGVIYDFIRKLIKDPRKLEVLGNGLQAKPYVFVGDLVVALRHSEKLLRELIPSTFEVFNVAPPDATSVRFIATSLLDALGLSGITEVVYGESAEGWPGDVAQSRMDYSKLLATGFKLPRNSDAAVTTAIAAIISWLREYPKQAGDLQLPAISV